MNPKTLNSQALANEIQSADKFAVEVISTESGFDKIREEWNELVDIAGVSIFQTYEWQRIWWQAFGGRNRLHILLVYKEDRLAGIFPLFVDIFWMSGVPVYRCLRFIGSSIMQPEGGSLPVKLAFGSYLCDITNPEYQNSVHNVFIYYLKNQKDLFDSMLFEEVPADISLIPSLDSEFTKSPWNLSISGASSCPLIKLPPTWQDFLGEFNSKGRYEICRFVRRVTKDKIFKIETAQTLTEVRQAFRSLVELHQKRWNHLGQPGIFADQRIHDFYRKLVFRFHETGRLLLRTANTDGKCVAVDLMFTFKDKVYSIQRSFDDSPAIKKYAPGNALLYCCIRDVIEEGYKTYDFLRGVSNYKLKTASHIAHNIEVKIYNQLKVSRIRLYFHKILHRYVNLRRKLQNEKNILALFFRNGNLPISMFDYAKNGYGRLARNLKK